MAETAAEALSAVAAIFEYHTQARPPGAVRTAWEDAAQIARERAAAAASGASTDAGASPAGPSAGDGTGALSAADELLEQALTLRTNGISSVREHRRWKEWERRCEAYLRSLAEGEQ